MPRIKLKPEVKTKWIERLRNLDPSLQGQSFLRTKNGKMCCLGVLCEIAVEEGVIPPPIKSTESDQYNLYAYKYVDTQIVLPQEVVKWAYTPKSVKDNEGFYYLENPPATHKGYLNKSLAEFNDEGTPFTEIADIIEKNF